MQVQIKCTTVRTVALSVPSQGSLVDSEPQESKHVAFTNYRLTITSHFSHHKRQSIKLNKSKEGALLYHHSTDQLMADSFSIITAFAAQSSANH